MSARRAAKTTTISCPRRKHLPRTFQTYCAALHPSPSGQHTSAGKNTPTPSCGYVDVRRRREPQVLHFLDAVPAGKNIFGFLPHTTRLVKSVYVSSRRGCQDVWGLRQKASEWEQLCGHAGFHVQQGGGCARACVPAHLFELCAFDHDAYLVCHVCVVESLFF